jgi:uncharacterized repeat protein (TIGR03803 family)
MASVLGFHRSVTRKALWVLLVLLVACQWAAAPAEAYSILHNFTASFPDRGLPLASLILDADGNLYGTTRDGTVFKLKTDGTGYTILHNFIVYPDGVEPFASLILDVAGNLYGTTRYGGAANFGTVYTLKTDGTGFTILHSFSGIDNDGAYPLASLILDAAGNLYGTTSQGGLGDCYCGTVFTLKTDGTGFTGLYSFTGSAFSDGAYPRASLILDAGGNLYGTTVNGGLGGCSSLGCGTVFTLKTDGTGYTVLRFFNGGSSDGSQPWASLILDAGGNLYGTTLTDGLGAGAGCGTVFTLKTDGTGYTILRFFNGGSSDGCQPGASLILDAGGNLYGTTGVGGPGSVEGCFGGCGTVFKLKTDGTGYTILHFFAGYPNDGAAPAGAVIPDAADNLYGTTYEGGSFGYGTVFVLP